LIKRSFWFQVKQRHLFGDLVYTYDSDLLAVLMHLGFFRMMDTPPIGIVGLKAIVRAVNNPGIFIGCLRNGMLSKTWYSTQQQKKTCAYKVF